MPSFNSTPSLLGTEFDVLCFPGEWSWWKSLLSVSIVILFVVALFANLSLLLVVWAERSLHTPMYYFICILALLDLTMCLIVAPIVISVLLFDFKKIHAHSCFLQIYFISALVLLQSGTFMVMAYDRYIAICKPLLYPSIISNLYVLKALAVLFVRNCLMQIPLAALPAQLDYCVGNVVHDCYCNPIEVTALACDSNPIIGIYIIFNITITTGFDISFITFSYFMIIRAVLKLRLKEAAIKALGTCGSHFIVISYYYFCQIILIITNTYGGSIQRALHTLLAILFCLTPPVVNPLVYALRTKHYGPGQGNSKDVKVNAKSVRIC